MLAKEPSDIEIYNDADGALVNLFRVVRDSKSCAKLQRALAKTLYSRAEFELAKEKPDDPIEAARRFIKRITKAGVARTAKMSREHLSRRYGNLFGA